MNHFLAGVACCIRIVFWASVTNESKMSPNIFATYLHGFVWQRRQNDTCENVNAYGKKEDEKKKNETRI